MWILNVPDSACAITAATNRSRSLIPNSFLYSRLLLLLLLLLYFERFALRRLFPLRRRDDLGFGRRLRIGKRNADGNRQIAGGGSFENALGGGHVGVIAADGGANVPFACEE